MNTKINKVLKVEGDDKLKFSIIVPVYNEKESVPVLHDQIHQAMDAYSDSWEVVYVDDGSKDGSPLVLEEIAKNDPDHTRVIVFRRNFGQTAAVSAGIDYSRGEVIVLMDADLQNDPSDIPMLLDKIDEGYDLVSGWRKSRKDAFITRTLPSNIANAIISKITGVKLHDYGCSLKAYRREVITGFRLYGEMHRFIPAYSGSVGAKITEVVVKHHPRRFGKANYGLERTVKVLLDLMTVKFLSSYARKPIYLFGGIGMGLMGLSGIGFLYMAYRKFVAIISVTNSPFFLLSIMFFILGVQSILLGLIAELTVRTYHESQEKPIYAVRYVIDGDKREEIR